MPQSYYLHRVRHQLRARACGLLVGVSLLPCAALAQALDIEADGERVIATSQAQANSHITSVAQPVPSLTIQTLRNAQMRFAANVAHASASANALETRVEDERGDRMARSAGAATRPKARMTAAEAARRRGVRRMNVYPLWVEAVVVAHHPVGSTGSLFFRISI